MKASDLTDCRAPQIESSLAAFHGRRFAVLTNRGTTALYAGLKALDRPGSRAVFPAVMCSIPVFAAEYAGMLPAFADVSLSDGNFDLDSLESELKKGNVGAVVPIHMFGKPQEMAPLSNLAARYGAAVVEDVALSMGAVCDGKPAGSFGQLACLSFVRKMLPLEMGGAVLTDDAGLAESVRRSVASFPTENSSRRVEVSAALKAFHSLTGYVAAGNWDRTELLRPFSAEFRRLLLASTTEADWAGSIVLDEMSRLGDGIQARRARAEVYDDVLGSHPAVDIWDRTGSSLFAYPVRLRGVTVEDFLAFSENQGYTFKRIAYPDIHPVFSARLDFPNAAVVEREVMALPLDDDQPVSAFWGMAMDFRRVLDDYLTARPSRPAMDIRGRLELRLGGLS